MKIIIKQTQKGLGKKYTPVVFVEKGSERCVETTHGVELHIPVGKLSRITPRTIRTIVRGVVQSVKKQKLTHIVIAIDSATFPKCGGYGSTWFWSTIAENLMLAEYEYTTYKSRTGKYALAEVVLVTSEGKAARDGVALSLPVSTPPTPPPAVLPLQRTQTTAVILLIHLAVT